MSSRPHWMYVHGFGFLCAGECHNQCLEEHSEGRCECRDNSGCADGHFCSGDPTRLFPPSVIARILTHVLGMAGRLCRRASGRRFDVMLVIRTKDSWGCVSVAQTISRMFVRTGRT